MSVESNALKGVVFVNTRPRDQAQELTRSLERYGAVVIEVPMLRIVDVPLAKSEVIDCKASDWLVFTSSNAVDAVTRSDLQFPTGISVAAIGAKTTEAARAAGFAVGFQATESNAEAFGLEFAEYLASKKYKSNPSMWLLHAEIANASLGEILVQKGYLVHERVVYKAQPDEEASGRIAEAARRCRESAGMLIFTSSRAVQVYAELMREDAEYGVLPTATIGPKTTETVREEGLRHLLTAKRQTTESLLEGILDYYKERKTSR